MNFVSCVCRWISNNLENGDNNEIGLQLLTFSLSPFLKIGVSSAIFNRSGKIPCSMQVLKSIFSVGAIISALILINLVGAHSELVDFLGSSLEIYRSISKIEIGFK